MKKRKGKQMTKAIALLASLALAVGLLPAPALAIAGGGADGSGSSGALAIGALDANDDGAQAAADASADEMTEYAAYASSLGGKRDEAIDLTKKLIIGLVKADPEKMADTLLDWGLGKLLNVIFGDVEPQEQASLDDVLAAIEKLESAVEELQNSVTGSQFNAVLNNVKPTLKSTTTHDVYSSLEDINDKQKEGTYSEETAKTLVLNALIEDLGIRQTDLVKGIAGDEGATNNKYDEFVDNLWEAMTETFSVNINGQDYDYTLMHIWYEHLRYKYHWEHQAYDEWAAFQAQSVTMLMTALNLEKASLQARIEMVNKWNDKYPERPRVTTGLKTHLKKIQDRINQVAGYKGKDKSGNDVDYPGLFSEATWASQYWMYKQRDDSERFFWRPGHEIVFYTTACLPVRPQEDTSKGANASKGLKLISEWADDYAPVWDFWKPFFRYEGNDEVLFPTADELKYICNDYKGSKSVKSLWAIFFSKNEGNFTRSEASKEIHSDAWYFVVDPDKKHQLKWEHKRYDGNAGTSVTCSTLAAWDFNVEERHAIWHYFTLSNMPSKVEAWVGLGVKRRGPEPNATWIDPQTFKAYTATESGATMTWPLNDELSIKLDSLSLGPVTRVTMDDEPLDASAYRIEGDTFALSAASAAALPPGRRVLALEAERGSYAYEFCLRKAQNVSVAKTSVTKTFGDAAFSLGARTDGDGRLSFESSNTKVATVGNDGKVAIKGAGTARITVSAAQTDSRFAASTVVTIKVSKARNPITLSKKTVTVKYAKLENAKRTVSIKKAKKAQGAVTYSITKAAKGKKSFKKKFSINKKTGKIAIAKGLAKGTYKVTVKATAKGNANYKSGSKTAVVTIKVK